MPPRIQNTAELTVNAGFATVGTDTGHEGGGTDASWAHNNIERRVNFGYLAVHRTAETAKAIVAYRESHGPFTTVEQLLEVRGIGPAKLDQLTDLVRV